jgi:plastocyanin
LRANITAGTEVIWLNQDGPPHTVVSGDPGTGPTSEFRSGLINSGKNFTHTFTKAGVYDYYDPTYRHMKGQVVVN